MFKKILFCAKYSKRENRCAHLRLNWQWLSSSIWMDVCHCIECATIFRTVAIYLDILFFMSYHFFISLIKLNFFLNHFFIVSFALNKRKIRNKYKKDFWMILEIPMNAIINTDFEISKQILRRMNYYDKYSKENIIIKWCTIWLCVIIACIRFCVLINSIN